MSKSWRKKYNLVVWLSSGGYLAPILPYLFPSIDVNQFAFLLILIFVIYFCSALQFILVN